MLKISRYTVAIKELNKIILDNANLEIGYAELFVLIGPNGSGKSSFATSLLGLEEYERTGSVLVNGKESVGLRIDEIAKLGLFVSFQNPPEFEGIAFFDFVMAGLRALRPEDDISTFKIRKKMLSLLKEVGLGEEFLSRQLNLGFSGGEKRKSEILQMLLFEPSVAVLDEVDSGLDIHSLSKICNLIKNYVKEKKASFLVISHNPSFIKRLEPDKIYTIKDKQFVEIGLEAVNFSD